MRRFSSSFALFIVAIVVFLANCGSESDKDDFIVKDVGINGQGINGQVSGCDGFETVKSKSLNLSEDEWLTQIKDEFCRDEKLIWKYNRESQILSLLNKNVWLNCCGRHSISISFDKETGFYVIDEVDKPLSDYGDRCDCTCFFDFKIDLSNIELSRIKIKLCRKVIDGYDQDTWEYNQDIWEGELNLNDTEGIVLVKEDVGDNCWLFQ